MHNIPRTHPHIKALSKAIEIESNATAGEVSNTAENNISQGKLSKPNHYINYIDGDQRGQNELHGTIDEDNGNCSHRSIVSKEPTRTSVERIKDIAWDSDEHPASIEPTSEGEEEDESDYGRGECVRLCVPLTAGCVQISIDSKYFPAFLNKGESTYFMDIL